METFGATIKRLRSQRNLSLMDIERATGVKNGNFSLMERGLAYPGAYNLQRLAEFLGFSFDIAAAQIFRERAEKEDPSNKRGAAAFSGIASDGAQEGGTMAHAGTQENSR